MEERVPWAGVIVGGKECVIDGEVFAIRARK